eukprot:scaffold186599_cov30-Tisochrysis_lutea.AAC.1
MGRNTTNARRATFTRRPSRGSARLLCAHRRVWRHAPAPRRLGVAGRGRGWTSCSCVVPTTTTHYPPFRRFLAASGCKLQVAASR